MRRASRRSRASAAASVTAQSRSAMSEAQAEEDRQWSELLELSEEPSGPHRVALLGMCLLHRSTGQVPRARLPSREKRSVPLLPL